MSNGITEAQNTDLQLKRLLAQRNLYSRAKLFLAWQMIVTVVFVVVWSLLVLGAPAFKAYAALWGIIAVLLDFVVFAPYQQSLKRKAAGIQELFDCDVLQLPWQEIKAREPPDTETVTEWSQLPAGATYDTLQVTNWYPSDAAAAPLTIGRLICQRASCWWDAKLRRRYTIWIAALTATLFTVAAIIGLIGHVPLDHFLLAGILPFLPVLVISIRQYTDQVQAATRLDDLKRHAVRLWSEALSGSIADDEITRRSRTLQDEIFEQRRRNPLIFNWVYNRLRNEQEEIMNQCASELLKEARTAHRAEAN